MRDEKRIDVICNKLNEYWHKVPDWRFGQLFCNFLGEELNGRDLFFVEDDEFEKMLDKYFNEDIPLPGKFVNNHLNLNNK